MSCSYDELKRFKKSSAKANYTLMCNRSTQPKKVDGLVQIIIDNFDASLSSPNGLVFLSCVSGHIGGHLGFLGKLKDSRLLSVVISIMEFSLM